ncbi:MAG: iron-sulfur cluster assembly accessory protein [Planctomycetia bacterium]|nr:iron-sulfur cluster assembly accessory protein [Planctomycetia bacterium]
MITLTPVAADKVQQAKDDQNIEPNRFLRIGIAGGGCSGFKYGLAFDSQFHPDTDVLYETEGIAIVVRKKMAEFLDGTVIDYKIGEFGEGFAIENPLFPPSMGCAGCHGH